jgi:hypothetical protein
MIILMGCTSVAVPLCMKVPQPYLLLRLRINTISSFSSFFHLQVSKRTKPSKVMLSLFKFLILGAISFTSVNAECKVIPGSAGWPSCADWDALNQTLGGQLIKPTPPGAVCHSDQPTYNNATCAVIAQQWSNYTFHADNPVSTDWDNANNDTCLPDPAQPCSPIGYPVYVVNATTPEHVAMGVNFAAANNIRLIVKATGHDYLGR